MSATPEADKGNAEVAARIALEQERGYFGTVPDTEPNAAYTLLTGPDAPALAPDDRTRSPQFSADTLKEG